METQAEVIEIKKVRVERPLQDYAILGLAILLDFTDAVPMELLSLFGLPMVGSVGYEAAISVLEASFLTYLGVPIVPVLGMSGTDLIPGIDFIPWCTLAVLDKRFDIKIPYITSLFNF